MRPCRGRNRGEPIEAAVVQGATADGKNNLSLRQEDFQRQAKIGPTGCERYGEIIQPGR